MARRILPPLALLLALVACAPAPEGPTEPLAPDQVASLDGLKAAGARDAAMRFVSAYATASTDDADALASLAATPLLRAWVHWLRVQNVEFPGTINGEVLAREVGPAVPFSFVGAPPGAEELLRQVDLRASVAFESVPSEGQPFSVTRSLDGPMHLIQNPEGVWQVANFTRDGIPLTRVFEVPQDAEATAGGVRVSLGSFLSFPYWQFGLVVESDDPIRLTGSGSSLVDDSGAVVASADAVSGSLQRVPAGATIEGLVTFPAQPSAAGLSLRLRFDAPGTGTVELRMPLEGVIDPLPTAPASPSG